MENRAQVISRLTVPYPCRDLNPAVREAEIHMWEWCSRHELLVDGRDRERLIGTQPHTLAALFYPQADPEFLRLVSCFFAWAFLLDDRFDEGGWGANPVAAIEKIGEVEKVVTSTLSPEILEEGCSLRPMAKAIADLLPDLLDGRPSPWERRFIYDVNWWLSTYVDEAFERYASLFPELAAYAMHRCVSYGTPWIMDLCEAEIECELLDVAWLPEFFELRAAMAACLTPVNDIYSAERDVKNGYTHNAVILMSRSQGCSLDDAACILAEEFSQAPDKLARTAEQLVKRLGDNGQWRSFVPAARRLVASYETIVAANLEYHRVAAVRYGS
jgi:hypothetical protein